MHLNQLIAEAVERKRIADQEQVEREAAQLETGRKHEIALLQKATRERLGDLFPLVEWTAERGEYGLEGIGVVRNPEAKLETRFRLITSERIVIVTGSENRYADPDDDLRDMILLSFERAKERERGFANMSPSPEPVRPREDGNGAFPYGTDCDNPGMSLRDYFAAAALQGLAGDYWRLSYQVAADDKLSHEDFAVKAYSLADAMIRERKS